MSELSLDDDAVVQALRAYQSALEAGERPDRASLLDRFPGIADELSDVLDGLEFVNQVAPQLHERPSALEELRPSAPLGDFRIVREIGRGGMGVVYEAEQMSLGRRVALKVLPFAAVLDGRCLQRFKNEAQAAAHLHHTNIVPVHAVGNERGVHYYAMQYIEGPTVAELIDELKASGRDVPVDASPAIDLLARDRTTESPQYCRAVAGLGIQAAEALDYAHESGVVHRDIKPPNLIVDAKAHVWITDFGLASTRNDAGLTVTGDIVGTLRYMSPEQAMAKRVAVDHRTDIYSLGVTLYELLTLRQAFPGHDPAALTQAITSKDPIRPSRLNRATPSELETILLKAMAKDPTDRYATASALADDLRRYLEHRPIAARRPPVRRRLAQWARRHRVVVGAAAAVLLVAVVALSVGTVLLARKQERLAAEHARAERNLDKARWLVNWMVTRVADELADEPRMGRLRRSLLEQALAYHLEFLEQRGDEPAARSEAAAAHLRVCEIRSLLGRPAEAAEACEAAIGLYESLADEFPGAPAHRHGLVSAQGSLAQALAEAGRRDEAEQVFRKALSQLDDLTGSAEPQPAYLLLAANLNDGLGSVLEAAGRRSESRAVLERARSIWERLAERSETREHREGLADTLLRIAQQFELPAEFDAAERMMRRYLDIVGALAAERPSAGLRSRLANGSWVLGNLYCGVGRQADAVKAYNSALSVYAELAAEYPSVPDHADRMGKMLGNLAGAYRDLGDNEKRKQALLDAQKVYAGLVAKHGDVPAYRHAEARSHYRLSHVHAQSGDAEGARRECARAIEIFEGFDNDEVASIYRFERPDAYFYMALFLAFPSGEAPVGKEELERAEAALQESIALTEALLESRSEVAGGGPPVERALTEHVPACLNRLAPAAWHLALVRERLGRDQPSVEAYLAAIDYSKRLIERVPDIPRIRVGVADLYMALGRLHGRRGRTREAAGSFRQAAPFAPEKTANLNEIAWFLANCSEPFRDAGKAVELARQAVKLEPGRSGLWNTLGVALCRASAWKEAVDALERSMGLPDSAAHRGWDLVFLAMARKGLGQEKSARDAYDEAVAWQAKQQPQDPELERFRAEVEALLAGSD